MERWLERWLGWVISLIGFALVTSLSIGAYTYTSRVDEVNAKFSEQSQLIREGFKNTRNEDKRIEDKIDTKLDIREYQATIAEIQARVAETNKDVKTLLQRH